MGKKLEYTQDGRGGSIVYLDGEVSIKFSYELAAPPGIIIIFIPKWQYWESQTGLPLKDRDEILEFVCKQVIIDKARGYRYSIGEEIIDIIK